MIIRSLNLYVTQMIKTAVTLYYSKLYYAAEVWHLPELTLNLKKSIKFASANALKLCLSRTNLHLATHTEIHRLADRAMPEDICLYRHAIMAFKLLRMELCDGEFMQLNFK